MMGADAAQNDAVVLPLAYRRRLLSYFGRRLSNRDDAEDLAQEVLCRVYSSEFRKIAKLESYIFGIAANLLKDQFRRKALSQKFDPECGEQLSEGTSGQLAIDPERIVISRELLEGVQAALLAIPEKSRDIFLLFRVHGVRQRQLAADFGVSVSSIEKHIVKASVILAKNVERLCR